MYKPRERRRRCAFRGAGLLHAPPRSRTGVVVSARVHTSLMTRFERVIHWRVGLAGKRERAR